MPATTIFLIASDVHLFKELNSFKAPGNSLANNSFFSMVFSTWLRLNVTSILLQIEESREALSSYALLKKFHGLAW